MINTVGKMSFLTEDWVNIYSGYDELYYYGNIPTIKSINQNIVTKGVLAF